MSIIGNDPLKLLPWAITSASMIKRTVHRSPNTTYLGRYGWNISCRNPSMNQKCLISWEFNAVLAKISSVARLELYTSVRINNTFSNHVVKTEKHCFTFDLLLFKYTTWLVIVAESAAAQGLFLSNSNNSQQIYASGTSHSIRQKLHSIYGLSGKTKWKRNQQLDGNENDEVSSEASSISSSGDENCSEGYNEGGHNGLKLLWLYYCFN